MLFKGFGTGDAVTPTSKPLQQGRQGEWCRQQESLLSRGALGGAAANACNLLAAPVKHGASGYHVISAQDGGISVRRTQKHLKVECSSAVLPAASITFRATHLTVFTLPELIWKGINKINQRHFQETISVIICQYGRNNYRICRL